MKKSLLFLFVIVLSKLTYSQCAGFSATLSGLTNSTTYQACDGSATVNVTGGTAPYTYYWFPGAQTTATVNTMCAANHTVYVTDSLGCGDTISFVVTSPPNPCIGFHMNVVTTDATHVDSCNATVTINLTGGVAPFTYNYGGLTPTAPNYFENVCTGYHGLSVIDSNGCYLNYNYYVYYPGACETFTAAATVNNVSAVGSCDGSVALTTSGGTPPFSYNWYTIGDTNSSLSSRCSGFYPVVITDAHGCSAYTFPVVECPGFTVTASSHDCPYYDCSEGYTYAVASGGTPPYTYDWWWKHAAWDTPPNYPYSDMGVFDSLNTYAPPTWKYLVVSTDAMGCAATSYAQVHQPTEPTPCDNMCTACQGLTVYYATDQNTCDGVVLPPGGYTTGIGGTSTPPYSLYWPATHSFSDVIDSAACPGPYLCVLTDSRGCTVPWPGYVGILNYVETVPITPDTTGFMSAESRSVCIGSASAIAASGFPPYSYAWEDGETTSTATNLCVGLRTVIVTDNNGARDTADVVVSNAPHTYLNNQVVPATNYICTDPVNNCSLFYSDIVNVSIDSFQIQGPNKVNVTWRVDYATHPASYIPDLYHVIPTGVVEFIIGIYCETPDSNYITARDRINFSSVATSVGSIAGKQETGISIYPNPFSDELTISLHDNVASKLTITDQLGRIVYTAALTEKNTTINTERFGAGMYFVNVSTSKNMWVGKIIRSN